MITKTKVETNIRNSRGKTALDALDKTKEMSAETCHIKNFLARAGGERTVQVTTSTLEALSWSLNYMFESDMSVNKNGQSSSPAEIAY